MVTTIQAACRGYDMVWLGMFFLCGTADVLCIEVHKRREKVGGGEHIDAIRNTTWLL